MVGEELRPCGAFTYLMVLSMIHSCRGQSDVVGPSQPIVALVGADVVLPCHLQPAIDASSMTVEWSRPDMDPRFILVWRDALDLQSKKHPSFRSRTSLFTHELKQGNISLKLSSVKLPDQGMYRCFAPELDRDATAQLVVGAASSPVIEMISNSDGVGGGGGEGGGRVVLQCESRGWYPEPEVLWLDAEGNLLSAGPPETVRGPDDLYTVSSRVTVDKRHNSNSFTCRVQQNNTHQTREAYIHVPGDYFSTHSSSSSSAAIIGVIIVALVVIVAVSVFLWKWRQKKLKNKKDPNDEETQREKKNIDPSAEALMGGRRDRETLEDEDMKTRPGLHYHMDDKTQQIQTNHDLAQIQGEREEGAGITERNSLDTKTEPETEPGREKTEDKTEEKPETRQNQQTEEGENMTTQRRGDEMNEGKHGGETLDDKEQGKIKKKIKIPFKKIEIKKKKKETQPEEAKVQKVEDERKHEGEGLPTKMDDKTQQIQTNHDLVQTQGDREEGAGITERNSLDTKTEPETEPGREKTEDKTEEKPETRQNQQTEEGENMTTQRREDEMNEGKHGGEPLTDEDKEKRKKKTKIQIKKKKETQPEGAEVQNVEDERKHEGEPKDKEKEKLKTKLQTKERDEKKWEERVSRLKSQIEEKQKQINEVMQQKRQIEEMEKERLREEDGTEKPPLETKKDLEKKKSELDKDLEKKQLEIHRMRKEESVLIERRNKATKEKEEIVRKLDEVEKEKNDGENQRDSDEDL